MTDEQATIYNSLPPSGIPCTAAEVAKTTGKAVAAVTFTLYALKQAGLVQNIHGSWWHRAKIRRLGDGY